MLNKDIISVALTYAFLGFTISCEGGYEGGCECGCEGCKNSFICWRKSVTCSGFIITVFFGEKKRHGKKRGWKKYGKYLCQSHAMRVIRAFCPKLINIPTNHFFLKFL